MPRSGVVTHPVPRGVERRHRLLRTLCLAPLGFCGRALLFMAPLLLLAAGVLYLRIVSSPMSIAFLARPIERALNAGLVDRSIRIDGAVLHKSERGGIEVRLRRVRLLDERGGHLAESSWAGVEISMRQLLNLRIAPLRIELIEPRIVLAPDSRGRLSISVQDGVDGKRPAAADGSGAAGSEAVGAPVAGSMTQWEATAADARPPATRFDAGRLLADIVQRMRAHGDHTDHLRTIGLRNATLVIGEAGRQSTWMVKQLDIDLKQKNSHQTIAGTAIVAGAVDPWAVRFLVQSADERPGIRIKADVAGLTPSAIASGTLGLGLLAGLDVPVTATCVFDLASDGALDGWHLTADLGAGQIATPGGVSEAVQVRGGRLESRWDGAGRRLELLPSTIELDVARVAFGGTAVPGDDGSWRFDVVSRDGVVAGRTREAAAMPIEHLELAGRLGAPGGGAEVERLVARVGPLSLVAAGRVDGDGGIDITGSLAPIPVSALKGLVPRGALPGVEAALDRLAKGTVTTRSIRLATPAGGRARPPELTLVAEGQDLEIALARALPPLEAPRALLRVEGGGIELTVPEAQIVAGANRRIALRGSRATITGLDTQQPQAEVSTRVQGPLPVVLDLLDREPMQVFKGAGPPVPGIDGRVDAQLKVALPLGPEVRASDARIEGRARITDGRIKDAFGNHDVSGATITIEATEPGVDVRGELLLAGVNVKLAGSWPSKPAEGRPPTLEFNTRLDRAYREQLGFDVEHMITDGAVPVRVVVQRLPNAEQPRVHVSADLTGAELTLTDLWWRKAAGRPARLEFDVGKGAAAKTLELQNFKLVGENIGIDGWVGIGPDNRAREYVFPEFTLNVVTNLSVRGHLRNDAQGRVWVVSARGKTFDARDLFRSFYSFTEPSRLPKGRPGVDLEAEIDTVLGANDTTLRNVKITMQQRNEKLHAVEMQGALGGGKQLSAVLRPAPGRPRVLEASTTDAGQSMKLVGFYSSLIGGAGEMQINLDGRDGADKTGRVHISRFQLLGDPIVQELFQGADAAQPTDRPGRVRTVRQQFDFDQLYAGVSVGSGQLVLEPVVAEGPLVGVNVRGKLDFRADRMHLGGTYVPLSGINRALSGFPLIGQILTGPRGEGIFGITFEIKGPMSDPKVNVNPLSLMTPGFLRELFQTVPENPRITPKQETRPVRVPAPQVRSSEPATDGQKGVSKRKKGKAKDTKEADAGASSGPRTEPEVLDGWSATAKRKQQP